MVVEVGLTLVLPLLHDTDPTPLLIEQLVACAIPLHASVEDCPAVIVDGLAENDPMLGAAGSTVTVAVLVAVPPAPVAVSV